MNQKPASRRTGVSLTAISVLLLLLLLLVPPGAAAVVNPAGVTPVQTSVLSGVRTIQTVALVTTATETPQTGYISIASTPSGASVTIDGSAMGTTPFTTRTISLGEHTLLLQMNGYQDLTATFTVTSDTLTKETYTLVPVTTAPTTTVTEAATVLPTITRTTIPETAASPAITATPRPETTVTPSRAEGTSLAAELEKVGPVTISPVTIRFGNHTKMPVLNTFSPWFAFQFDSSNLAGTGKYYAPPKVSFPVNYIEVDQDNVYLPSSHLMSSADMALDPTWGDEDTVYISTSAKFYNNTNFRWTALDKDVTALYQVSRYPFSANATAWQNQYVTGLIASGPAKDVYADSEGFHYFSLNFAKIANHDPSKPPYYTGVSKLEPTLPGQGKPMGLAKIPFTESGIWFKKFHAGPLTIPVPDSLAAIPVGEYTEQDLADPNGDMIFSDPGYTKVQVPTAFSEALMEMDQTFYVRIVPIHKDGTAGTPTLPVTVTVKRPHPCPANTPSEVTTSVVVKPPSAEITSFYMNLIVPDWIHTDQNGVLVSRAHFVTVATPPYCSQLGGSGMPFDNAQFCEMFGGSEPGYHFYADPAESHWYDTVWDIITGLFSALSSVVNAVSNAWNQINNLVVQIAAYAVQGLTLGAFDCNSSPACTGALHAALAAAESALGIPPTIPNVADLESMGADYLAKVAAEQLGAGGVLDAAETAYDAMPDSAKKTIKEHASEVGESMGDAISSETNARVATTASSWYIPDPLYYQPHPAIVMVKVTNPNSQTTDQVRLSVKDTGGFFKGSEVVVPPLKPYDSTVIPLVLAEDYSKGYTSNCNSQAWTMTNGIPCYWENWNLAAHKFGTDQFVISTSVKKNGQWITGLSPSSSGTVLSSQNVFNIDEEGKVCPGYTSKQVIRYPDSWQMQLDGLSQDLDNVMWNKYTFTKGGSGRLIGA